MSEDKLKVDINSGGASFEASGEAASTFQNLIRPFSEAGRAIGDRVQIWGELWNFEAAVRATRVAKEIAEAEGILIEPKSAKFLKRWAINVSLETDQSLEEKRARLLISFSSEFKSQDAINVEILSKLNGEEVRFLSKLKRKAKHDLISPFSELCVRIGWLFGRQFPMLPYSTHKKSVTDGDLYIVTVMFRLKNLIFRHHRNRAGTQHCLRRFLACFIWEYLRSMKIAFHLKHRNFSEMKRMPNIFLKWIRKYWISNFGFDTVFLSSPE